MAIITKAIRLETTKQNLVQAVIAKQGDCNSRYLKVTFLDEGATIPLDSSWDVTINAEREDGAADSFFGVVNDDDTATVPLHSWILELDGVVNCDISIIGTDSRLTTTTFVVKVEKAACSSGDISTDPQYDVLANLINDVSAAKNGTANAIVGTVSGTAVAITDVSPLEHNIGVKLASKNIIDQSKGANPTTNNKFGITLTYIPEEDCLCLNGTNAGGNTNVGCSQPIDYVSNGVVGQSYVASVKHISGTATIPSGSKWDACFFFGQKSSPSVNENANWLNVHLDNTDNEATAVCTKPYIGSFWAFIVGGVSFDNYKFKIQLELGSNATEYAPFVEDLASVTLKTFGENLWDEEWRNGTYNATTGAFEARNDLVANANPIMVKEGEVYAVNVGNINVFGYLADGTLKYPTTSSKGNYSTITITSGIEYINFRFGSAYGNAYKNDICVRKETAERNTLYVPYEGKTYNGTVESVTSLYPTTTLMTDTEGVTITAEYNRDTNKVIESLVNAIISLGGNV